MDASFKRNVPFADREMAVARCARAVQGVRPI
jgi:hypothetical protein